MKTFIDIESTNESGEPIIQYYFKYNWLEKIVHFLRRKKLPVKIIKKLDFLEKKE